MKDNKYRVASWIVFLGVMISSYGFAAQNHSLGDSPEQESRKTTVVRALQKGDWKVSVTNFPSPTSAERIPFQSQVILTLNANDFFAEGTINIPAGKRLALETISVVGDLPAGQKSIVRVQPSTVDLGAAGIFLVPIVGYTISGVDNIAVTQPASLFATTAIQARVNRSANTGTGNVIVSVVGRLESI